MVGVGHGLGLGGFCWHNFEHNSIVAYAGIIEVFWSIIEKN